MSPSLTSLLVLGLAAAAPAPAPPECVLRAAGASWSGSCGALVEGEATSIALAPAAAITSGAWRRGETPSAVWAGTIVVGDLPATPVEIEMHGDRGLMRTVFGWFPVERLAKEATALRLDVDAARQVAPSALDREIVERAATILATEAAWNRADDRRCPAEARTWSLYCALEKATIEVAGAFHHRRPALEVVRAIVDQRTAGRPYEHRLMDYNNDRTTHLDDVRSLFAEALQRIDAAIAAESGSGGKRPGPSGGGGAPR